MFFGLFSRIANSITNGNKAERNDPLAFLDELVVSEKQNSNLRALATELKQEGQQARRLVDAQRLIGDAFEKGTVESLINAKTVMASAIDSLIEDAQRAGGSLGDFPSRCLPTIFKLPNASHIQSPLKFHQTRAQYDAALEAGTIESLQRARVIFTSVVDAMIDHRNGRDPNLPLEVSRQPAAQITPSHGNGPLSKR